MAPEMVWDGFSTTAVIGSMVLVLFAVAVGIMAKMRGPALHYVLFAGGFGIGAAAGHMVSAMERGVGIAFTEVASPSDYTPEMVAWVTGIWWIASAAYAIAIVGIGGLLHAYGGHRPTLLLAGAGIGVAQSTVFVMGGPNAVGAWPLGLGLSQFAAACSQQILMGIMAAGSIAMALAFLRDQKTNQALLGAALAAYPIMNGLWAFLGMKLGDGPVAWLIWAPVVYAAAILGSWAWVTRKTSSKVARNVTIFLLVASALALAMSPFPQVLHMGGLARAIDVFVVAYAILRHQYLGLDVKIRWGLSKTTIAALFIAVFFVVSELAASLFSERWGTELGIVAAGALVFGIAPIMRWADRFAAAAVPSADHGPEERYLEALRVVSADGHISPEEEDALARLADSLGLGVADVTRLRRSLP